MNESQQKIYQVLRHHVTGRLVRADIADTDLAALSLGELLNTLFLLLGDGGSTGSFVPTFTAALKLVGPDLMWQEPDKIAVISQRVQ
jgi:hypothetical protein